MKQKIVSLLSSELLLYILLCVLLFGISYGTVAINFASAPPDVFYYGGEEYPIDFSWNMTTMQHGYNGRIQSYLNYTSVIPIRFSWLKIEYVLLGHIARITGIQPLIAFWIARFVISIIYLGVIYFIIRKIFRTRLNRILAYILVLFGTSITFADIPSTFVRSIIYDGFVFHRLTLATIHYQLGGITSLISVFTLYLFLCKGQRKFYFFVACISGMITGFINGPNIIFVVFSLPFTILLLRARNIMRFDKRFFTFTLPCLLAYAFISCLPLIYVKYVMTVVWEPQNFTRTEDLNPFKLNYFEYVFGIGATYFFSLIGAIAAVKKKHVFLLFLVPWIFTHFIGVFFLPYLMDFNIIRFFLTQYFVGFGILGAYGISATAGFIAFHLKKPQVKQIVACVLLIVTLALGSLSYKIFITRSINCFCLIPEQTIAYPEKDLMEAIFYIKSNSQEEDIVMSSRYTGVLVSAFAGNRVHMNWWAYIADSQGALEAFNNMNNIFTESLNQQNGDKLLHENNIKYLIFSDQERKEFNNWAKALSTYSLTEVFEKNNVIVYKVNPN